MNSKRLLVSFAVIAGMALTSAAGAPGEESKEPAVTAISPSKPDVGEVLVIRGRQFTPGARKNTVVFRSPEGRSVFVKADTATKTRLRVTLPTSLEALMGTASDGSLGRTRFRLRVLSARFGRVTAPPQSPQIGPAEL